MLTPAAGVVGLALLAAACATGGRAAPPAARRPAQVPAAAQTPAPAGAEVVRGGFAHLHLEDPRDGYLRIEVASTQTVAGAKVVVTYERNAGCVPDPVTKQVRIATCRVVWSERREVPASAFTFDDTLAAATLSDTLRGRPLTVTWQGYGEVHRSHNTNGNLVVELRDAKGTMRWGGARYTDPDATQAPSQIYRRVTPRRP